MTKTHLTTGCGRGKSTTTDVSRVTCLRCQGTESYAEAKEVYDREKRERFLAQVPRQMTAQFGGPVVCRECGGDRFRMGDRTCFGHYENYHCAACGNVESRLTETGMSF